MNELLGALESITRKKNDAIIKVIPLKRREKKKKVEDEPEEKEVDYSDMPEQLISLLKDKAARSK